MHFRQLLGPRRTPVDWLTRLLPATPSSADVLGTVGSQRVHGLEQQHGQPDRYQPILQRLAHPTGVGYCRLPGAFRDLREASVRRRRREFVKITAKASLQALGLSFDDIQIKRMPDADLVPQPPSRRTGCGVLRGNDPYPIIQEMLNVRGVSFISMSRIEIRRFAPHRPFLHSTPIPAGIYGNQPEIETVGGDMLLVCRADLPDELVYWVTRTLFELLPEMTDALPSLRQIDPEHVQASPLPLHAGAARFYRERELFP